MGNYEDAYRDYYLDTKAKLKIKTDSKKTYFKNKNVFNEELLEDIYPKMNYESSKDEIYNEDYENSSYDFEVDDYEKDEYIIENNNSKNVKKNTGIIEGTLGGTYRGLESYSGINNYNNINRQRGFEVYNGSSYYGQVGGENLNVGNPMNNLVGSWINRFIIKLALTVALFIFVVGLKYSPYEKTRNIYTSFKVAVDKDFKYEEFIETVKTIDIMEKVNEFKESLQMKPEEINNLN